jgi:hypothetical protein
MLIPTVGRRTMMLALISLATIAVVNRTAIRAAVVRG